MIQRQWIKSTIIISVFVLLNFIFYSRIVYNHELNVRSERKNPLNGCKHIYLDVGTNIGVQIRKLFEPSKYERALVHEYFDRYFGSRNNRKEAVCAVGFEPNIRFEAHLKKIEASYNKCGFRNMIFTRTAVSHHNKREGASFFVDGIASDIGGTILKDFRHKKRGLVDLLRLSDFIRNTVLTRSIPHLEDGRSPSILMKMDIEGSETSVLPDLILSGILPHVDMSFIEWHEFANRSGFNDEAKSIRGAMEALKRAGDKYDYINKIRFVTMDDESYFTSNDTYYSC